MRDRHHRTGEPHASPSLALCAAGALGLSVADALAQGWGWWPWSQPEPRRIEREPIDRPPMGGQLPPGQPPPGQQPPGQVQPPPGPSAGLRRPAHEQPLPAARAAAGGARRRAAPRAASCCPRSRTTCARSSATTSTAQMQLNRADCWDQFLFSRTLRRTPALRRSSPTRPTAPGSGWPTSRPSAARSWARGERRSYQDDIIRELARNNCGPQYQQEARRRDAARNPFSSLWGEESEGPRGSANQFGNLPFATYRTLCVRLCDGYYFPVSFSTLPNHFQRDCGRVPVAVRGPGRALLSPEPRRSGRADGVGAEPAALYRPEIGLALPQGVRAGLLVQGGRVPAAGGRRPEKAEAPAAPAGQKGATARLDPR